jgi:hypothetical protein
MLTFWYHGVVASVVLAYHYSAIPRPSWQWRCEDYCLRGTDNLNCRERTASIPLWKVGTARRRVGSPEMPVHLYQTVLHQIPEDRDVHTTALFLTFPISNLLQKIQHMNFKIWSIITLFTRCAIIAVMFFDTIRTPIPSFLIKLVKLNF